MQFIQVSYTLIPARFPTIKGAAGNVSEHHSARFSWNSLRTEVNCCEICSSCGGGLLSQNKTTFRVQDMAVIIIQPTMVVDLSTWRKAAVSTCQQNSAKMYFINWPSPFHLYNDSRLIVIGSVWVIYGTGPSCKIVWPLEQKEHDWQIMIWCGALALISLHLSKMKGSGMMAIWGSKNARFRKTVNWIPF